LTILQLFFKKNPGMVFNHPGKQPFSILKRSGASNVKPLYMYGIWDKTSHNSLNQIVWASGYVCRVRRVRKVVQISEMWKEMKMIEIIVTEK
jgi:hypothetical protein